MTITIEQFKALQKGASLDKPTEQKKDPVDAFVLADDGEEYMPVGTDGILAASEKLLAVNRGLVDPDERDSMKFQKIYRTHALLREGIAMDAGKLGRQAMYRIAKANNLQSVRPFMFEGYVERMLVGNPLTSPLEEINPMQLDENARRITKMGPGGIGSSQAITTEMQNVSPSQFGFISVIEGPECWADINGASLYTQGGWKSVASITKNTKLACLIDGRLEFHKPEKVTHEYYNGVMYGYEDGMHDFLVTPQHRLYGKFDGAIEDRFIKAQYAMNKTIDIPCCHKGYEGIKTRPVSPAVLYDIENKTITSIPYYVFELEQTERNKVLDQLIKTYAVLDDKSILFTFDIEQLATDTERLAIELGKCVYRQDHDNKYTVRILPITNTRITADSKSNKWRTVMFSGMVHCATVPGGKLLFKSNKTCGSWFGNSERAGIDNRATYGSKIGSDGRLYQKFKNRRTGRNQWLSAVDIADLVVKIPD